MSRKRVMTLLAVVLVALLVAAPHKQARRSASLVSYHKQQFDISNNQPLYLFEKPGTTLQAPRLQ